MEIYFHSPEVASRKSHGLESDVWNFGCLVYTMLVGKPPFEANFVRATLNNVLYGNYKVRIQLWKLICLGSCE